MPENVSRSYDAFQKARHDFIKLTHQTEALLKKEKAKLTRQLKRANARVAKEKARLIAAEIRLEELGTVAKKIQVKNIRAIHKKEKQIVMSLRDAIRPLSEKLSELKKHVVSARYIDRGMQKIDKEIESFFNKKNEKTAKKKKSVKKRSVKKKATTKKAVKKKAVKKKAVKKKAVKKKAIKKKSVKKKAVKKKSVAIKAVGETVK